MVQHISCMVASSNAYFNHGEKMRNNLTHGNIAKTLIQFTIPLILSGLLQQIFNWVDAFIVGNVEGELALAGVGATTSIYNLFVTIIIGFSSGISVFAAQKYGMGEKEKLKSILSAFIVILGSIFLAITILGIPFTNSILVLLNTPDNIFSPAKEYIQILFIGIPFLAIYNIYSALLRGLGDSKVPFLSVLVCSVINIILDILFVIVLRYGAAGAAAATAISQAAMTIFIIIYTISRYPELRFKFDKKIIDKAVIIHGLSLSIPPAVQAGAIALGNIILQRFMNGFGEQTVAAITTAYRVDSVILLPIINFGSGIATMVAQNIGANNKKRAKSILKTGIIMMAAISISLTALILTTGDNLIKIFGLTQESVQIGKSFFNAIASFYIIYGLSMAARGYLEGIGDMIFSGIGGIAALCVRVISSYAFAPYFGRMIIAYAEAFSWLILLAIYIIRLITKYNSCRIKI